MRVIPRETGEHAGLSGSFRILTMPDGAGAGYVDIPGGGWAFGQPAMVRRFGVRYDLC
jgi:hypothetical protein